MYLSNVLYYIQLPNKIQPNVKFIVTEYLDIDVLLLIFYYCMLYLKYTQTEK